MTEIKRLTIIVPVFNEIKTVGNVLEKLRKIKWKEKVEVVVVDDGSNDGTTDRLKKESRLRGKTGDLRFKFIFKKNNEGKGAAVKTALGQATGEYVIIQDADLEYDPAQIDGLVNFAKKGEHRVVYGSRNLLIKNRYLYPHYYWGAKALYLLINVLFGQRLSDPETCYKLMERKALDFDITEKGFGLEIELTARLAQQGIKIAETSISYNPRGFEEGKKIRAKDGVRAVYLTIKYWIMNI